MAAEDKKIGSLTEWLYASVQDTANMVVAHAGANYRILLSTLKQYVLGNKTIGGNAAGDVLTTNASQQVSNKAFSNISINDQTIIGATGTEINHLSGINTNIKHALDVLSNNVGQNFAEIDNIYDLINEIEISGTGDLISTIDMSAGTTVLAISASSINPSDIDGRTVHVQSFSVNGDAYSMLPNSSITINLEAIARTKLSNIVISPVDQGKQYRTIIRYRLLP